MSTLTPVQEFYNDSTVFLTGATGFVGSAILEKLLRSCPGIKRIYVLIRPKKGITSEERLDKIFNSIYFDRMKKENPNFKNCITLLKGDLFESNLGFSEEDLNTLINEINIVIHVAATVKFNEKMKTAVNLNMVAPKYLLELSKSFLHLKSYVHVSTAYSHCYQFETKEEFYNPMREPNEFIEYVQKANDEDIDEASIIGRYPNTYSYTKGLAEEIVRKDGKGLPLCIVRPSIVMGSWNEPIPGWVNNLFGPFGLMAAVGYGIMRCSYADSSKQCDLIPVDMTANAIISAAASNTTHSKDENIQIYNLVTGNINPVTWGELFMWAFNFSHPYSHSKVLWTPMLFTINNAYVFEVSKFFLHIVPAYIFDTALKIAGKKPLFVKIFDKIHTSQKLLLTFVTKEWKFHDDNMRKLFFSMDTRDQQIFNFDVKQIEWDLYFLFNCRMTRIHLMGDPISTVPIGLKRMQRFKIINHILLALFCYLIYYIFF